MARISIAGSMVEATPETVPTLFKQSLDFITHQRGKAPTFDERFAELERIRLAAGLKPHGSTNTAYEMNGRTYDLAKPPTTLDVLPSAIVDVTKERVEQVGKAASMTFDLIPLRYKIAGGVALVAVGAFGVAYLVRSFK